MGERNKLCDFGVVPVWKLKTDERKEERDLMDFYYCWIGLNGMELNQTKWDGIKLKVIASKKKNGMKQMKRNEMIC